MSEIEELKRLQSLVERFGDRMKDAKFLIELIDQRDKRIVDLLNANNGLVGQNLILSERVNHYLAGMDACITHTITGAKLVAKIDGKRRIAMQERDNALQDAQAAWVETENHLVENGKLRESLKPLEAIVATARNWYRSIAALNQEKGRNLENNRTYTRTHIALKTIMTEFEKSAE
jgi:hypothetical protein